MRSCRKHNRKYDHNGHASVLDKHVIRNRPGLALHARSTSRVGSRIKIESPFWLIYEFKVKEKKQFDISWKSSGVIICITQSWITHQQSCSGVTSQLRFHSHSSYTQLTVIKYEPGATEKTSCFKLPLHFHFYVSYTNSQYRHPDTFVLE